MADFPIVMEKLQGFETADDIAEFLMGYGIKASPGSARHCAISVFVKEETGYKHVVTSSIIRVYNDEEKYRYEYKIDDAAVPTEAMRDFIVKFDNLTYPDLIG